MKVLVINLDSVGEGLAFCVKCVNAGHEVRLYLSSENNPTTADGFKGITKILNWVASIQWADITFVTGNHQYIERLDAFKKRGFKIFSPSAKSSKLEIDRSYGMKFIEDHGIQVPEQKQFPTLKAAENYVRKNPERFVFKTLGDEDDKSLSYCSKDAGDMVARLQHWQNMGMKLKGPCILQDFIDGIEFAVSRWMGTEGFIGKFNENFEHKKLLSGNLGPNCGESGTVQKYVNRSELGEEMLLPLEESLVDMGHLGDIDVNCIIDNEGRPWPLEFTCRPGWPAFNIMLVEHIGDPVEWMLDACEGRDTMDCDLNVATGIVVGQPDYPYSNFTKKRTDGVPIYGLTDKNRKYIHPQALKTEKVAHLVEGEIQDVETWVTTGDYIAVVTGTGKTVKKACDRAYTTVREIHIPDIIYRDDIGEDLGGKIATLQNHGYATEWEYE